MNDENTRFIRDISFCNIEEHVCVTGVIVDHWKRSDHFGLSIKDITGRVNVRFDPLPVKEVRAKLIKGKRIRIRAQVILNSRKDRILSNVSEVECLEEMQNHSQEENFYEQESAVLISNICNKIRYYLSKWKYIEINTEVLSRYSCSDMLEPLRVEYLGFGSPAYLSQSPSAQLNEFLTATLLPRVFAITTSFSTSYRFPNGATETPVVMAKALDLSEEDEKKTILWIANRIAYSLVRRGFDLICHEENWTGKLADIEERENTFHYMFFKAHIPVIGDNWNSAISSICHLLDDKGNLLVESARESVTSATSICTITFYPNQFLGWVSKSPRRQLKNLWKLYEGGSIYG